MKHEYHTTLHSFTDQAERMLMCVLLVLFGGSLATGILDALTWKLALIGLAFVLVIRPASGLIALAGVTMHWHEKLAIAFFGIRGIGTFFYLSFGLHHATFSNEHELWALAAFIVLLSLLMHGLTAPTVMKNIATRHGKA